MFQTKLKFFVYIIYICGPNLLASCFDGPYERIKIIDGARARDLHGASSAHDRRRAALQREHLRAGTHRATDSVDACSDIDADSISARPARCLNKLEYTNHSCDVLDHDRGSRFDQCSDKYEVIVELEAVRLPN